MINLEQGFYITCKNLSSVRDLGKRCLWEIERDTFRMVGRIISMIGNF